MSWKLREAAINWFKTLQEITKVKALDGLGFPYCMKSGYNWFACKDCLPSPTVRWFMLKISNSAYFWQSLLIQVESNAVDPDCCRTSWDWGLLWDSHHLNHNSSSTWAAQNSHLLSPFWQHKTVICNFYFPNQHFPTFLKIPRQRSFLS